jgi:hypothetical protein
MGSEYRTGVSQIRRAKGVADGNAVGYPTILGRTLPRRQLDKLEEKRII